MFENSWALCRSLGWPLRWPLGGVLCRPGCYGHVSVGIEVQTYDISEYFKNFKRLYSIMTKTYGAEVGLRLGSRVGSRLGTSVGCSVGYFVGRSEERRVGKECH